VFKGLIKVQNKKQRILILKNGSNSWQVFKGLIKVQNKKQRILILKNGSNSWRRYQI